MTNKEKYPKTEDALKAFGQYELEQPHGCGFRTWLDCEAESNEVPETEPADKNSDPSTPSKDNIDPSLTSGMMGLAALVAPLLASRSQEGGKNTHVKIEVDVCTR